MRLFRCKSSKKYNPTDRITHIFRFVAFARGRYCVNDLEAIENPININFAFYSYIGYNKIIGHRYLNRKSVNYACGRKS